MAEGVRSRGVGEIVGGDVNGLDGRDGPRRRVADPLLEFRQVRGQRGLITETGGQQPHETRDLLARLDEPEDVVDEEQHVLPLLVAEVFRHGEPRVPDPEPGPGRFVHLAEDHDRIAQNAGLLHLPVELLALAAPFPDTAEDADALVPADHVVDHLRQEHRLPDAGAAEKTGLAASFQRAEDIDGLDPRFEDLRDGGLLGDRDGCPVYGPELRC